MSSRLFAILPLLALQAWGQPQGFKAYFGNLHSHTSVSDGVKRPAEAFLFARDKAGTDFLCLSEHNHNIQTNTTQAGLDEVLKASLGATNKTFIALTGQEFSTISGGNHINVYDVSQQIPTAMNSNYRELFENFLPAYQKEHPDRVVVAQFNHPDKPAKDYGLISYTVNRQGQSLTIPNYQGDVDKFRAGANMWVRLIAIISGPADVTQKNATNLELDTHKDIDSRMVNAWHKYLDMGLNIGPAADQDNHSATWGGRTAARTGVWVQGEFNKNALLRAIRGNRTFASEDKNLSIWFTVNGQPMGSHVVSANAQELAVEVRPFDANEASSTYTIELFDEVIGDGQPPVRLERSPFINNGATWQTTIDYEPGSEHAYLIKVMQRGDGNQIEEAWTSPVWVGSTAPESSGPDHEGVTVTTGIRFVGSRNSNVYHYPDCGVAEQIQRNGNLVEFKDAPAGKRLHKNCPTR